MSEREDRKVPQIRFKGFESEWEEKTLGQIVLFLDERRKPLKAGSRKPGRYPYYGASGIIDYVEDYLFSERLILLSEDGANIIDRNYPICFIAEGKYWVNNHAHVLRVGPDFSDVFIRDSLERLNFQQYNTGTAQPKLNQEVCRNIPIRITEAAEQTQIGEYFRELDSLIGLHQHKHDKLATLKQAMLQKMFPQLGATTPEIRFKGFEGEWEGKALGGVCAIGDTDHWMPQTTSHGIPYVMTGDFVGVNEIDFQNAKLISLEDFARLSRKIKPETGDILFARYASVGAVRFIRTNREFIASYSCAILKRNDSFDSEYLFFLLQTEIIQNLLKQSTNTGSQGNIGIDSLKQLVILFPNKNEQTKIAHYFRQLDELIARHATQLEKLKQVKAACLEKMFV